MFQTLNANTKPHLVQSMSVNTGTDNRMNSFQVPDSNRVMQVQNLMEKQLHNHSTSSPIKESKLTEKNLFRTVHVPPYINIREDIQRTNQWIENDMMQIQADIGDVAKAQMVEYLFKSDHEIQRISLDTLFKDPSLWSKWIYRPRQYMDMSKINTNMDRIRSHEFWQEAVAHVLKGIPGWTTHNDRHHEIYFQTILQHENLNIQFIVDKEAKDSNSQWVTATFKNFIRQKQNQRSIPDAYFRMDIDPDELATLEFTIYPSDIHNPVHVEQCVKWITSMILFSKYTLDAKTVWNPPRAKKIGLFESFSRGWWNVSGPAASIQFEALLLNHPQSWCLYNPQGLLKLEHAKCMFRRYNRANVYLRFRDANQEKGWVGKLGEPAMGDWTDSFVVTRLQNHELMQLHFLTDYNNELDTDITSKFNQFTINNDKVKVSWMDVMEEAVPITQQSEKNHDKIKSSSYNNTLFTGNARRRIVRKAFLTGSASISTGNNDEMSVDAVGPNVFPKQTRSNLDFELLSQNANQFFSADPVRNSKQASDLDTSLPPPLTADQAKLVQTKIRTLPRLITIPIPVSEYDEWH